MCEVSECGRPMIAKNYCTRHYWRWRYYGTPEGRSGRRLRGTGTKMKKGYIRIALPEHPNADKHGRILEHVAVMSEMLDRPLYPGENVHHKNGIKDDNRPENLELWVVSQPSGQRPEDLVTWAKLILERYG